MGQRLSKNSRRTSPDPEVSRLVHRPVSPPPTPKPARPIAIPPRPDYSSAAEERNIPPPHEDLATNLPHRDDHPARNRAVSSILVHGLPGLEGQNRARKKRTGQGVDHIWDDLTAEYDDSDEEARKFPRRKRIKPPVNKWNRDGIIRKFGSELGFPSRQKEAPIAGKAVSAPEPTPDDSAVSDTVATEEAVSEAVAEDPLSNERVDSARPKAVAIVAARAFALKTEPQPGPSSAPAPAPMAKKSVHFEDVEETPAERAAMEQFSNDCLVEERPDPKSQEVLAPQSPTLLEQEHVPSSSAKVAGSETTQLDTVVEEEVEQEETEGSDSEGCDVSSSNATVDGGSQYNTPEFTASPRVTEVGFTLEPRRSERAWWTRARSPRPIMDFHWTTGQV